MQWVPDRTLLRVTMQEGFSTFAFERFLRRYELLASAELSSSRVPLPARAVRTATFSDGAGASWHPSAKDQGFVFANAQMFFDGITDSVGAIFGRLSYSDVDLSHLDRKPDRAWIVDRSFVLRRSGMKPGLLRDEPIELFPGDQPVLVVPSSATGARLCRPVSAARAKVYA